jgi:hypothetical protein
VPADGELVLGLVEPEPELLPVGLEPVLLVALVVPVLPPPRRPVEEPLLDEPLVVEEPLAPLAVPLELLPAFTGESLPSTLPFVPLLPSPEVGALSELVL